MKSLHHPDLYAWSSFDEDKNIDFNGTLWVREGGNIAIDPMPMSAHDRAHLDALGGLAWILMTNSDHTRSGQELAAQTGAKLAAPVAEKAAWPYLCDAWLAEGDAWIAGLQVLEMNGSKTPGELALIIEGHTLVTGDLVRAHRAGSLMILPDPKLSDREAAMDSVRRLANIEGIEAVLVGDGWPIFRDGTARLRELAESF
jgi:glyoxylase-like metal-dependent hydrolase (beta-lactamase superfamily II)